MITTLILCKKNRKILKDGGIIITILVDIAIYIAFKAMFDLNGLLQSVKFYYSILAN